MQRASLEAPRTFLAWNGEWRRHDGNGRGLNRRLAVEPNNATHVELRYAAESADLIYQGTSGSQTAELVVIARLATSATQAVVQIDDAVRTKAELKQALARSLESHTTVSSQLECNIDGRFARNIYQARHRLKRHRQYSTVERQGRRGLLEKCHVK